MATLIEQDLKDDQRVTRSVNRLGLVLYYFIWITITICFLSLFFWVWHEVNRSYHEGIKNPDIQAINRVNQQTYGILESAYFCVGCD